MKKLLALLFFLLPTLLFAGGSYTFRTYNMEDGLSQDCVWAVMQDSKGFMWFGTKDGLDRFDGNVFKSFRRNRNNSSSLGNNFIKALAEDDSGNIWVGTDQGLYIYDPLFENFTHISFENVLPGSDVTINSILRDSHGYMWLATHGQGLICVDQDIISRKHFRAKVSDRNSLPTDYIWSLAEDANGLLWIGTVGEGLAVYDPVSGSFTRMPLGEPDTINDNTIYSLFFDSEKNLWAGTYKGGLNCLNPRTGKVIHYLTGREIYNIKAITPYSDHELIMGSDMGLIIFDTSTGDHQIVNNEINANNLSDRSVFCIARDNEGSFWIGTYFGGVNYYSPQLNRFSYHHPLSSRNSIKGNIISCFAETGDGRILIGTNDAGLSIYDPVSGRFTNLSDEAVRLRYHNVQSVLQDGDKVWIGLYSRGVDLLDIHTGNITNYSHNPEDPNSIYDNNVFSICKTSSGNILLATPIGVNVISPDGKIGKMPELENIHVKYIIEDSQRSLWFATNNHGLYCMSDLGRWQLFRHDPSDATSLRSNHINCIHEDTGKRIWVGCDSGGLHLLSDERTSFVVFDETSGLLNDVIYSVTDDQRGNIWLTTNSGLSRIVPETQEIRNFMFTDDMQKIRYNYNCMYYSTDNRIYAGGTNGFVVFNPDIITDNTTPPPVVITGLQILNHYIVPGEDSPLKTSVTTTDRLTLGKKHSSFNFDFAALSYISPGQNRFAYILEGYDREWNYPENGQRAHYMNIPSGNYIFRVRASNNDGVWNEAGTSVSLTIRPPFMLSGAMIATYFTVAMLIIAFAVRQELRRINRRSAQNLERYKNAKEKENYESKIRFFTNIAHEIRTPLTLITAPLENIERSGEGSEDTVANLATVRRNTNRLLELVNQLLDFRKMEEEMFNIHVLRTNVSEVVRKAFDQYASSAKLKGIVINLEPAAQPIIAVTDGEALYKIVSNLLSNGVKYARQQVNVRISTDEDRISISVSDDGRGIDAKYHSRIFEPFYQVEQRGEKARKGSGLGLALSQSLANMLEGEITICNNHPCGSVFTLTIPMATIQENNQEDAEISRPGQQDVKPTGRESILIAEDNEELLEFLFDNFSGVYRVVRARDGIEALRLLETETVNLIISDIMMPGTDGLELCRMVKTNPAFAHIPVILLSAKTDISVKVQGLEYGADIYLEKPFSVDQLKAQVSSLIQNRLTLRKSFLDSPLSYIDKENVNKHESAFISSLNDYITANMGDKDFSIDSAAVEFNMSRSNFHKKIKTITGLTPNDYIKLIRLNKAAQMLASGKYKVNEVGYMTGFNTPSYFSKCFLEQFGKLPKEFLSETSLYEQQLTLSVKHRR